MDTIVKYRFDREMVSFVKTLDLKQAMFGYDKNDVYSKFKDLLVKAREVCEELVSEAYSQVDEKMEALKAAVENPAELALLLENWESDREAADEPSVSSEEAEEAPEEILAVPAVLEAAEADTGLVLQLREENEALRARLQDYADREELLQRAHDIVSEARLEREEIVRNAQVKAEEELFLYRARRRDEEVAYLKQIQDLEEEKKQMEEAYGTYLAYAREGQALFEQLTAYAGQLALQEDEVKELTPKDFDPPVLSADESLSCTEESMPLCEIVETEPEGIFRGPDPQDNPDDYENKPEEEESTSCSDES